MKKLLFLILLGCGGLHAQVALTSKDYPQLGDTFMTDVRFLNEGSYPLDIFSTDKAQFAYDLTNIVTTSRDTDAVVAPSTLNGGDQVTGADYGFEYGIGNAFMKNSDDNIEMVALAPQLGFPFTLAFQFDEALTYMDGPNISYGASSYDKTTSKVGIPFFLDVEAFVEMEYEVNGYGTVTIPGDITFDVIRLRRETHFYAEATQLISQQTDTIRDSTISWEFYAPGYSSTVLRVDLIINERNGGLDTGALFSFYGEDSLFTGNKNPINTNSFTAQLNSIVKNELHVSTSEAVRIEVYDLKGVKHYSSQQQFEQRSINLSHLNNGCYLVVLHGNKGSLTRKVYKE